MKYLFFFLLASSFFFKMPESIAQGSSSPLLVITEVMADPSPAVGLPDAEYVEIYNRSAAPVSLAGWTLYDGSVRTLPPVVMQPGEYRIICTQQNAPLLSVFGLVAEVNSLSLLNSGELISLRDNNGVAVDSLMYSDSWYGSSFKKDGGWSLERKDHDFICFNPSNWTASVNMNGGTPGMINSVSAAFTDSDPPVLWRAWCPDSLSVLLIFSEPVDPAGIGDVQNYSLSDGLQILQPGFYDASNTRILLLLSTPLQYSKIYSVDIKNLRDCPGNFVSLPEPVRFGLPDTGEAVSVSINELLFDPFAGGYDFVELYNRGSGAVDLKTLKLSGFDKITGEVISLEVITEEAFLIFPGEHVVLTENAEMVAAYYYSSYPKGFVEVPEMPSMNSDQGKIGLWYGERLLDAVQYDDGMHFELLSSTDGTSLEKIHPDRSSSDRTAWHSCSPAAGYATPGLRNSVYSDSPGRERQITIQPEIFSPDNDGFDDLITFSINSNKPGSIGNILLYNSAGQIIYTHRYNQLLASSDAFTWNGINDRGVISPPGIYVAIVEIFTLDGKTEYYKLPFVVAEKGF